MTKSFGHKTITLTGHVYFVIEWTQWYFFLLYGE